MGQTMYRSPALRWTTAKAPPPRDRTVHTNQLPVKSPASLGKRDTMTGRFWKDWRMGCGVTRNLRSSVASWWSDGAGRSKDGIRYDTIIYRCVYGILRCRWSLRVWWGGWSLISILDAEIHPQQDVSRFILACSCGSFNWIEFEMIQNHDLDYVECCVS